MKVSGLIVEDVVREGVFEGRPFKTRTLYFVDQDHDTRLLSMVGLKVNLEDPKLPQGIPSLRGATFSAAITRIIQNDDSKALGFAGTLLEIKGYQPAQKAA